MVLKISPWPASICGTNVARRKGLLDAQLIVEYFSGGAHQAALMTSCAASWQLGKAACSSFDDVMRSIMTAGEDGLQQLWWRHEQHHVVFSSSLQQLWWRSAQRHDTLGRWPPAALSCAASWQLGKAACSSFDDVMSSIRSSWPGSLQQLWWRHAQRHDSLKGRPPSVLVTSCATYTTAGESGLLQLWWPHAQHHGSWFFLRFYSYASNKIYRWLLGFLRSCDAV